VSGDHTEACNSVAGDWLAGPRFRGQHYAVSAMLRQTFESVAAEPLPNRIVDLLRLLDVSSAPRPAVPTGEDGNQSDRRTLRP
jgi:hypothetical protein